MTTRSVALARATTPGALAVGDGAMTQTQASILKTVAEEAYEPEAFNPRLTQTEAARRIEALAAKLRLQDGPPHTL
jgi:Protein of unknown function (DUF3072)